jgi:hypothetical protein
MKKLLFTILLCIGSVALFAQSHKKITVYCTIGNGGRIDYGDLKKLLPDSTNSKLLVDPRTSNGIKDSGHTLLLMTAYGWKLASVETNVTGGAFTSSSSNYLMTKDIYLSTSAYALYLNTLINIEKKPKK